MNLLSKHKQRIFCLIMVLTLILGGCAEQEQGTADKDEGNPTSGYSEPEPEINTEDNGMSTENVDTEIKTTANDISSLFEESGYTVICESVEQQILTGKRYLLTLSGVSDGRITLYEYEDFAQAQADVHRIDESGTEVILENQTVSETTYIEWKSIPHFYQLNNLIVQYVGTDKTILALLTDLCGEQFAGGDTA